MLSLLIMCSVMHNREEEGKHEESSAYVNPCSPEKKKTMKRTCRNLETKFRQAFVFKK